MIACPSGKDLFGVKPSWYQACLVNLL